MTLLYSLFLVLILRLCDCQETDPHSIPCKQLTTTPRGKYDNYNITIRSPNVHVTCVNDTTLAGSCNVTCEKEEWRPEFPRCLVNCPPIPDKPNILSMETISYVMTNDKNRAAGTTISLSCVTPGYIVNGSSSITCQHDRSWMPEIPKCRPKQFPPERRWMTILAIAGPTALVLVVCVIILGKLLLIRRFYRVWTIRRTQKKIIEAVDLSSLKNKASKMFNLTDDKYLKLVLEEDGSEIQTTSSMVLCQNKVLMTIDRNDKWKPVSSDESDTIRLTYDVCSFDRKQRKLFLANSLKDLIDQVKQIFGQEDNYLCLEIDGTVIDDDISLTAVAGQQLMSMNETNGWTPVSPGEVTESLSELKTDELSNDKKDCYKVWSKDLRYKKIIFASDLVDLHIKAARALSLQPPIEISLLNDDVPIFDNQQLIHHRKDILLAVEAGDAYSVAQSSEYTEMPDVLQQNPYRRNYKNDTYF
ncbi:unnamed protein product [Mytilus coruscus]|uniref:Sushi domain-containing protein n=1 Tax=Mytilus coruscus TaxID=42192 RepID=A0A6J8CZ57_MYTCO|nr:unnamed protein product [Mytilus coruscus]